MMKAHSNAACIANQKTREKFGSSEFEFGTPAHDYWIDQYDKAYAAQII